MMNDPFSSRDTARLFHSNSYAQVARGGTIGSTNAQSFNQRTHINRNRSAVRPYGASMMGTNYVRGDTTGPATRHAPTYGRPLSVPPRRTFREPPTRYNPYQ